MTFKNKYEKFSFMERCAWWELQKVVGKNPLIKHKATKINSFQPYDILTGVYNEKGRQIEMIVTEIKIRSMVFDNYYIEKQKILGIISYFNNLGFIQSRYKRNFVNMTPTGTYVWNMDIALDGRKLETKRLLKSKGKPELGYVEKEVYSLYKSEAEFIDFIWNEDLAEPYLKKFYLK